MEETDVIIWTAKTAPARVECGSFGTRGEMLEWIGMSEHDILEDLKRREDGSQRFFGDWIGRPRDLRDKASAHDDGFKRWRTWGTSLTCSMARFKMVARIAHYIRAAERDKADNPWKADADMTFDDMFDLAAFEVGGVLGRSKSFVWKVKNEVAIFVENLRRRDAKLGYSQTCSQNNERLETASTNSSQDTCARVGKTKRERLLKQCGSVFPNPCGEAKTVNRNAGCPDSERGVAQKSALAGGCCNCESTSQGTGTAQTGGDGGRLDKFSGKMPGRACWAIMTAKGECEEMHCEKTERLWSDKHCWAWLKSVMAAGKSLRAAVNLYQDTLQKWYGRDAGFPTYVPSGMYSELYKKGAGLRAWSPKK